MIAFWASFLVAGVSAGPILALLRAMRSKQTIDPFAPATHQAKGGTPTMGGLITLAGVVAGLLAAIATLPGRERAFLVSGLVLVALFGLIGFVDDFVVPRMVKGKRGLGWRQKIAMQVGAAVLGLLPSVGFAPGPLALGVFAILFASNAYNFADGLDGLAGSILLAYAAGLFGVAGVTGDPAVGAVALVAAGGIVPFLFVNAHPARVFMGDVGSLPLGALLGLASLGVLDGGARVAGPTPVLFVAVVALNLMLAAELVPVPIQVFWFKKTGRRVFPATPIHHGFEKRGWPETRVVAAFALAQVVFSALAVTLVGR